MAFVEVSNGDLTLWESDGDSMEIEMNTTFNGVFSQYIDKDDAIKIINHLKEQFDI